MAEFEKIDKNNSHPSIICADLNNNAFSNIYNGIKNKRIDAFFNCRNGLGGTYRGQFSFSNRFYFFDPRIK